MQQQQPPCSSGGMQGLNSLLNGNGNGNGHDHHHQQSQIHHHQSAEFDPASQDDFLEQMLSSLPSCSWTDLKSPSSSSWIDLNPNGATAKQISGSGAGGRDLSDETAPCSHQHQENVGFHPFDDQSMLLASKMRQHQISGGGGGGGNSQAAAASAAKLMLQQQQQLLMAARGSLGLPLSLGNGGENDIVDGSSFKPQGGDGSVQAVYNGFAGSLHGNGQSSTQPQHFHQHAQGGVMQAQSFGAPAPVMNQAQAQPQASGSTGGGGGPAPAQPKQRVRARRGQATDPHSIAERLRRERIAERMKALQELVPNANKTDKASMLDEIIDYVKFLQLQVKVLSMSRLGGAAAVAPLVADMSSEGGGGGGGGGDCIQANGRNPNGNQTATNNDSITVTEHQVAKLMEEDMGSAMQYLQGKGLCLMPISLATAISTATCHTRNPMIGNNHGNAQNPLLQSNGEGPSSPSMSVLTVQSATMGTNGVTDGSGKDAASVSKP